MYLLKKEELFIGKPAPLKEICLVYPLSAYQVLNLTQEKYNLYLNLLTMSDEDLKDIFEEKKIEYNNETVFSHIMTGCANDGNFLLDVKRAFFTFIREKVQILPESGVIIVGDIKEKRIIYQKELLVIIKMLDYYFYLSYLNKLINKKKYESISSYLLNITKYIYGWIRSEKKG